MAPLTAPRLTPERSGHVRAPVVKNGVKILQGAMVAVGADGFAVPMATAATLRGIGRAEETVDNTSGAAHPATVPVNVGIYAFANSGGADVIARKDIGLPCYGVDDQTVALTHGTNTRSIAGTIFDVDADGVWVDFR